MNRLVAGNFVGLIAVLPALLGLPAAARAESVPAATTRWGLLGTWSVDCSTPPSRSNTYETYVRQGNDVFLNRNGGDYQDSNKLLSAGVQADGMLNVRILFKSLSQTRVNVILKGPDGRKRAVINHDSKGSYSVKDGKFVSNGATTQWMSRCR